MPVVSRSRIFQDAREYIKTASPGLLAAVYALALPFIHWDERLCVDNVYSQPSSSNLWRIAFRCLQRELQFPKLSTVQICLLLLNQPAPDNTSAENFSVWSLASSGVAVAQALGLHLDPSRWKLPSWEIRLRRRLWWSILVEHSWRALIHGRFSLISHENWNVFPLRPEDFTVDTMSIPENALTAQPSEFFIQLCTLTLIADDVFRLFL